MKRTITINLLPANWKTTIAGAIGAIAVGVYPVLSTGVVNKEALIMAGAIGLVGWLAKDAGQTGTEK